jgi:hypothetical protein
MTLPDRASRKPSERHVSPKPAERTIQIESPELRPAKAMLQKSKKKRKKEKKRKSNMR